MQVPFLSPATVEAALKSVEGDIAAHKNWIMTAVEDGKQIKAAELVEACRTLETAAGDMRRALRLAQAA